MTKEKVECHHFAVCAQIGEEWEQLSIWLATLEDAIRFLATVDRKKYRYSKIFGNVVINFLPH